MVRRGDAQKKSLKTRERGIQTALRPEGLDFCRGGTNGLEATGDFRKIIRGDEIGMDRGAEFVGGAGCEKEAKGFGGRLKGGVYLRDAVVAFIPGGFDIQSHPIHQRQNFREPVGKNPRSVQADFEPDIFHRSHRWGKRSLRSGFASAEDHSFQKIATLRKKRENILPAPASTVERLKMGIVAIPAPPDASLTKYHSGEVTRIVQG